EPVLVCCLYFFFQAEDGIRDFHVTGVQTCALPIFTARRRDERLVDVPIAVTAISGDTLAKAGALDITDIANMAPNTTLENSRGKIGRASCRERVSISPVAVRLVMRRYMLSLSDHVL